MHALAVMQRDAKRFWRGCESGFIATVLMTIVMFAVWALVPGAMPDPIPLAITTGIIAEVAHLERIGPAVVTLGVIIQLVYGAAWGGLIAVSSSHMTAARGIVVGIGLWMLMIIFYVPMVGNVVLSVATNPMMWILTLLYHVIYGAAVGALIHREQVHTLPPAGVPT